MKYGIESAQEIKKLSALAGVIFVIMAIPVIVGAETHGMTYEQRENRRRPK